MRVLHVLPVMSMDGRFGGPQTVCHVQAQALVDRGHRVDIAAAWLGAGSPEAAAVDEGIKLVVFAGHRMGPTAFSGIVAPRLILWAQGAGCNYDVMHLHTGRHLTSLMVGRVLSRRLPFVVQPHGMLPARDGCLLRAFDDALVRPVLRRARGLLALTDGEASELADMGAGRIPVERVVNAVPVSPAQTGMRRQGHVVFLGRLHERKQPLVLLEAVARLRGAGFRLTLEFVGPDEGQLRVLRARAAACGLEGRVTFRGAVGREVATQIMASADIFVLPSRDEPFPMAPLEAMSLGVPVVITTSCGLAEFCADAGAAGIAAPTVDGIAREIQGLLESPSLRAERVERARQLLGTVFSPPALACRLENLYAAAIGGWAS